MKKVVITGAYGSVGTAMQELLQQQKERFEVYAFASKSDEKENKLGLDISDEVAVMETISRIHPDIIVNCAAFTAVDLCEDEKEMAYLVNEKGPENLAKAAQAVQAVLYHISTDYVYAGDADKPYKEEDETNPSSVYGKSKLLGDQAVLKYCKKSFVLRTAWIYGEKKSFANTMLRLANEEKAIRVVADQIGSPTSAEVLAKAILYLFDATEYGIVNITCSGQTSWYEFAKFIFEANGMKVNVEPISSAEFQAKAKRPSYSVLDLSKLKQVYGYETPDWKQAYLSHIKNRQVRK